MASLRDLYGLVQSMLRKHRLRLLVGCVTLISVDLLQLLIPRFVKTAVDALAAGTATHALLTRMAVIIFIFALTIAVMRFVWRYLIIGFSRLLEVSLRNRLFQHILCMDQPFFERWTTGNLMAHASNDLSVVQMAFGMGLVAAVDAAIMSTAALAFMLAIDVQLTILVLLPMPILVVCTKVLSGMLHNRFNIVQAQFSLLTESARAVLTSIRLIKAYTLEKFQTEHYRQLGEEYVQNNLKVARIQGLLAPVSTLVGSIGMLLLLYFGGKKVIGGQISIGSFVAFVSYLYLLIWPMMAVGWVANIAQRGVTGLRRIHQLLAEPPDVERGESKTHLLKKPAHYSCRHLSFSYAGIAREAISDLSLDLIPGIIGLTGRTGS